MKVGDYVRTQKGKITKIDKIDNNKTIWKYFVDKHECDDGTYDYNVLSDEMIKKSSAKATDLLEVGDIIKTNNLCGEITKIYGDKIWTTCYDGEYCYSWQIKSIITHEQFERMQYNLESQV